MKFFLLQVMAEREREEIEWQQYRKRAKKLHMRNMQEHEDAPRVCAFIVSSTSPLIVFQVNKKPLELDMSVLRVEFDLLTGNRDVERLDALRRQVFSIVNEILKEMRKFVEKIGIKVTVGCVLLTSVC